MRASVPMRLAWRDVLAHRARSALIAVLIAVPVLGVVAGATVLQCSIPTAVEAVARRLGAAQGVLVRAPLDKEGQLCPQLPNHLEQQYCDQSDQIAVADAPAALADAAPAGYRTLAVPSGLATIDRPLPTGQTAPTPVSVTVVDLAEPALAGRWDLVEGRTPTANEVAVSRAFLSRFGVQLGGTIHAASGEYRITGVAATPDLRDPWLFVGAGHPLAADTHETDVFLVGDRTLTAADIAALNKRGVFALSRAELMHDAGPARSLLGDVWFYNALRYGVLAAVLVSFVAGSAFAVGARSARKELGLLGAVGADVRTLREVMLWGALWVAGLGTLAGGVLGVGAGLGYALWTRATDVGLPVWGLHLPWLGVAAAVPLGLLSGLAAALAPVLSVSKLDALAAVRSADAPATSARFPWPGNAVLGVAVTVMVVSAGWRASATPDQLAYDMGRAAPAVGMVLLIAGTVLCLNRVLSLLAGRAPRRPLALRLALRDLDRHRARVVPAVGAVLCASTVAVLVMATIAGDQALERAQRSWGVHPGQILLGAELPEGAIEGDGAPPVPTDPLVPVVEQVVGPVAKVRLGFDTMASIDRPQANQCPTGRPSYLPAADWRCEASSSGRGWFPMMVIGGEPELRAMLGRAPSASELSALARGVVLTTSRVEVSDGAVTIVVGTRGVQPDPSAERRVTSSALLVTDVPHETTGWSLMSESRAADLGLKVDVSVLVLDLGRPVTEAEVVSVEAGLRERGFHSAVFPHDPDRPLPPDGWVTLLAAGGLVLLIAALTTALGVVDARTDEATLAAIGAPGPLRKRTTALHLGIVALLGTALGCVIAGVGVLAVNAATPTYDVQEVFPLTQAAVLVLGTPLVGGVLAWLFTPAGVPAPRRTE